jgi:hypothetical protein
MSNLYRKFVSPLFIFLAVLACVSCGGGGGPLAGGGIGGTGITTGSVPGFGSVFVNGVEFDTAGTSMDIDDVLSVGTGANDADVLGLGMVVTVTGTVNADGVTGTATSISYDEIVEGPIAAAPNEDLDRVIKIFDVLGITVVADRNSTVFVDTDYDSLVADLVVEVSGYFDAADRVIATRIEGVPGAGTGVELRGTVSGFSELNGVGGFMLGNVEVTFDLATVFEDPLSSVTDDRVVEVAGILVTSTSISAQRIELEDEGFSDSDAVSQEGIVTQFDDLGSFFVGGQEVNASVAAFSPASLAVTLGVDQKIEVEGEIISGVLIATEVEQRQGDIVIAGLVTGINVGAGTVLVEVVSGQPSISVSTDVQSQLEDEQLEQSFTLGELTADVDEVVIEGYLDDASNVVAAQIKRKVLENYELQGLVDAASGSSGSGSVTILGVTMQTEGETAFEDANDQPFPNGGDDFFSLVSPGDLVKIEDTVPVNGIADEVEFEN